MPSDDKKSKTNPAPGKLGQLPATSSRCRTSDPRRGAVVRGGNGDGIHRQRRTSARQETFSIGRPICSRSSNAILKVVCGLG